MATVLLVEDDPFESRMMEQYLSRGGHDVSHVPTAEEAVATLESELVDVVVTDLHLPGMSGLDLLRKIAGDEAPPVIVVTGDTDVTTAVDAMRAGAADYVNKPLTMKALEHVLDRVVETTRLRRRVSLLQREVDVDPDPSSTASSPAMRSTLELARRSAATDSAVLLIGESGVGKEIVAAYLHRHSPRAKGPFVRINVAAIPDTMIEAELFGAVRGAFTGAGQDRSGFFSAAHGGTILLDEIAELRPELQAKLLRVIETHRYYPVGARRELHSDVRIVAATNRDPEREVMTGRMRQDLYYRLASMVIRVPPLRERVADIGPLARNLMARVHRQTGRGPLRIDEGAIRALEGHDWPGNVRELRNVIERVAIVVDRDVLTRAGLEASGVMLAGREPVDEATEVERPPRLLLAAAARGRGARGGGGRGAPAHRGDARVHRGKQEPGRRAPRGVPVDPLEEAAPVRELTSGATSRLRAVGCAGLRPRPVVRERRMSEEDLSPYERHLLASIEAALDRLAKEEQVEVDADHRPALVAELLAAAANAETPNKMLKKIVRTLVDSDHVEEVYASDDELREILRDAIG